VFFLSLAGPRGDFPFAGCYHIHFALYSRAVSMIDNMLFRQHTNNK
jgi:hypothetical protein